MSARRVLRAGGLWFDGIDDYVNCGSSSSLMPPAVTALAWIYPTSYAVRYARVLEKGGHRIGGGYGLEFNPEGNRKQRFVVWNGEVFQPIDSGSVIPLGRWTHVAGVFDGVTMRLYINGVLEASRSNVMMTANTAPLTIGRATSGGSFFPGIIDDVRIYNRALTADEVRAIYERDALIRDGLVLYLDFSEYEGDVAYDKSGRGNHATIYGARWVVKKQLRTLPETG